MRGEKRKGLTGGGKGRGRGERRGRGGRRGRGERKGEEGEGGEEGEQGRGPPTEGEGAEGKHIWSSCGPTDAREGKRGNRMKRGKADGGRGGGGGGREEIIITFCQV